MSSPEFRAACDHLKRRVIRSVYIFGNKIRQNDHRIENLRTLALEAEAAGDLRQAIGAIIHVPGNDAGRMELHLRDAIYVRDKNTDSLVSRSVRSLEIQYAKIQLALCRSDARAQGHETLHDKTIIELHHHARSASRAGSDLQALGALEGLDTRYANSLRPKIQARLAQRYSLSQSTTDVLTVQ